LQRIILTVTNDLTYDQRMQRICTSLANAGYSVLLTGRKLPGSLALQPQAFQQKRLFCFFKKGFAFYAEYNLRLFFFLLFSRTSAICAIDLDTIVPCYLAAKLRGRKCVYDAHELFTEQKEIVTRPAIHTIWLRIERFFIPRIKYGYTVNLFIQQELQRRYHVHYGIIRNIPLLVNYPAITKTQAPFIIYQGAVNEGRSFETLIPAMTQVPCKLVICGKGNFFDQTKALVQQYHLEDKVILKGYVTPAELKQLTPAALFGLTLFESTGLNQYYSLSNRFFDYIMAGIPQVCVGYPEYKAINDEHDVALLINNTEVQTIADALNHLLRDTVLYNTLQKNCLQARTVLNWQSEEQKLIAIWQKVFSDQH